MPYYWGINKQGGTMDYMNRLGENSVNIADIFATITDTAPGVVLVDARAILTYIGIVAEQIVTLAQLDPASVEHYEAQAKPVLLIGDAVKAYVDLRSAEVPDTIEGVG
jgi:hypothetical protein